MNPTPGVRGVFFLLPSQLVRVSSKNINPKGSAKHEALLNTKGTGIRQVERKAGCQVRIPLMLFPKRKPCITPSPPPHISPPQGLHRGGQSVMAVPFDIEGGLGHNPSHRGVLRRSGGLGYNPSHMGVLKRSEWLGYDPSHRGVLRRSGGLETQSLTQGCT